MPIPAIVALSMLGGTVIGSLGTIGLATKFFNHYMDKDIDGLAYDMGKWWSNLSDQYIEVTVKNLEEA